MSQRDEKIIELVREKAAEFLQRQSNGASMLTVTRVALSNDAKTATIFFTVFPQEKEKPALDFAQRQRSNFKSFIKKETRLNRIPFFDFVIDEGEKNRQKIDSISQM